MSPDRAYLEDILYSAGLAPDYVASLSLAEFEGDTKTQDAVIRRLEVIGEAVKVGHAGSEGIDAADRLATYSGDA